MKRRIFISMPSDFCLTEQQNELKWAIVEKIREDYLPEVFSSPKVIPGIAGNLSWNADRALEIMRRCAGAVFVGLPRWQFDTKDGEFLFPTEFSAYEGALAHSCDLPMLVLAQENLHRRTIFDSGYGNMIGFFNPDAGPEWISTVEFQTRFEYWKRAIDARYDVFLGYCGSSSDTAAAVKNYLENDLRVSVLDWCNFPNGEFIFQNIIDACKTCSIGVFLFTKDDVYTAKDKEVTAPRDNVVFEAGYFMHAKGRNNTVIILEEGAKMLSDLGGYTYISLKDKTNIDSIKERIKNVIDNYFIDH
jgi:hypothetical protein